MARVMQTLPPHCRACGTPLPPPFLDLGCQPLANAFLNPAAIADEQRYPLRVRLCPSCALVQADDAVPPDAIFDVEYAYFSSFSDSWLTHCQQFAHSAIKRLGLGKNSRVMEIASNDGYLLQYFVAAGIPVLGIEPAANTAAAAIERGVPTEIAFFNTATGRDLAARGLSADLLFGANVLAHVPDLRDFLGGVPHVLRPGGTLIFEFPHLLELIRHMQFDTIYHEHFSYLSLLAVERALAAQGLAVYDVERLNTHGGSLRLYCAFASEGRTPSEAVLAVRADERAAALDAPATFATFAQRIAGIRDTFVQFVARTRANGHRIAAYGAAAKGNTFLNTCGITAEDIICVFDRNPHKQGKLMPGSHVPVMAPEQLDAIRPDFLVILPWNLRDEISTQLAGITQWGGQFVVAVPTLDIFTP